MNVNSKAYSIIFTFVACFIFVFILAAANEGTKSTVEKNKELFYRKAVLNAMNIEFKDSEDAYKKYDEKVKKLEKGNTVLYKSEINKNPVYAVIVTGNGLWSTITGVIAVDKEVTRIIGIDFISQSETPGLGGRIEEKWFKEQFRNEKIINNSLKMSLNGSGDGDKEQNNASFDAITGATLTSKSVQKIVNNYLPEIKKIIAEVDKK